MRPLGPRWILKVVPPPSPPLRSSLQMQGVADMAAVEQQLEGIKDDMEKATLRVINQYYEGRARGAAKADRHRRDRSDGDAQREIAHGRDSMRERVCVRTGDWAG